MTRLKRPYACMRNINEQARCRYVIKKSMMGSNSLPNYVHTIIATTDYKWDDKNKSDVEVCAYFDRLLVISALVRDNKKADKPPPHNYTGKKNSFTFLVNKSL
jgi:hypothetical protein